MHPTPDIHHAHLHYDSASLASLIHKDIGSTPRGKLSDQFRDLITPYLITDITSDQFLHIHRAANPLPTTSKSRTTLSVAEFQDFLIHEAPPLQEQYLNFKARGHTGCIPVASESTARLNRHMPGCANTGFTADGIHHYSIVSIEGRNYWLDFTIDQFVAYPEIIQRHRMYATLRVVTPPPSYAGTLVMPFCQP
jgi:hypothetical protein